MPTRIRLCLGLLIGTALAGSGCGGGDSDSTGAFLVLQPTAVVTTEHFTSVSSGNWHVCAISTVGQTWCWGSDETGQLGAPGTQRCLSNNIDCSSRPLPVTGGAGFASVAASEFTSCGLSGTGAASCWGLGGGGQLGNGLTANSMTPVAVSGGHAFTALTSSVFAAMVCALEIDSSVWCWGTGFGFGSKGPMTSSVPLRWDAVSGTIVWRKLAIGQGHACGLDAAGHAWCVGSADFGLLGDGSGLASATPVAVAGNRVYRDIAAGLMHSCAIADDGVAWCWGLGAGVGNGPPTIGIQPVPVAVTTDQRFVSIAAAGGKSCALTADGSAWCWGEGGGASAGDGTSAQRTTPVAVIGGHHFRSLVMGGVATCGIDTSGMLWCWGYNEVGAVGVPIV